MKKARLSNAFNGGKESTCRQQHINRGYPHFEDSFLPLRRQARRAKSALCARQHFTGALSTPLINAFAGNRRPEFARFAAKVTSTCLKVKYLNYFVRYRRSSKQHPAEARAASAVFFSSPARPVKSDILKIELIPFFVKYASIVSRSFNIPPRRNDRAKRFISHGGRGKGVGFVK